MIFHTNFKKVCNTVQEQQCNTVQEQQCSTVNEQVFLISLSAFSFPNSLFDWKMLLSFIFLTTAVLRFATRYRNNSAKLCKTQ